MNKKFKVCLISIVVCALLAILKYVISSMTGSISLKADSLHSFLDMLTSSLILVSIYLEEIKTKYFRLNFLFKILKTIIFISIVSLIFYCGYSIFTELFYFNSSIQNSFGIIFISIVSVITSHFLYRYQKKIGIEEKSVLILTDAFETRMDQLTSFFVLLSVVGFMIGLKSENTFVYIILGLISFTVFLWVIETIHLTLTNENIKYNSYLNLVMIFLRKTMNYMFIFLKKNRKSFYYSIISVIISMIVIYCVSGIYTLRPGQVAVVQYFGKYIDTLGQATGLNYSPPWPFSTKKILNIDEIKRVEIKPYENNNLKYHITKDENLIDVTIATQYKIANIRNFIFESKERIRIIKDIIESSTTKILGQFDIDDALVHKKQEVLNQIKENVQKILKEYKIGIHILSIQFKNNQPPREVIRAFNEVSSAREDKRTFIDNAKEYNNKISPEARGLAFKQIQKAQAFHKKIVLESQGNIQRLKNIYEEYQKAPYTYRVKRFLNLMQVLGNNTKTEVIDRDIAKKLKLRIYKQ